GLYRRGDQRTVRPGRALGPPHSRAHPQAAGTPARGALTRQKGPPMDDSTTLSGPARDEFEDVIRRFEDAWQGPARPDILPYLPTGPGRPRLLTELVHVDLEFRLRAGEPARVEEYLARHPELAIDRAVTLELIAAEHEFRRRREPGLALSE